MVENGLRNRPLLSASGIFKNFEGVYALTGVDFTLNAGEVHALLGANGAGKSTLIKILSGVHKKDSGELRIEGRDLNANDIATVYQELSLIPTLTVWQNIFLCHEIRGPLGTLKVNSMKKVAEELVERLGLHIDVNEVVSNLSIAAQQLVEIAKAVHLEAQVLILDEPTSTLTKSDQIILFERIRSIKKAGVGIIYVTHKLSEVFEIADRVTVLRDGKNVLTTEISKMNMKQVSLAS
jgi:ABC-type sugar transport system ATPase subunit